MGLIYLGIAVSYCYGIGYTSLYTSFLQYVSQFDVVFYNICNWLLGSLTYFASNVLYTCATILTSANIELGEQIVAFISNSFPLSLHDMNLLSFQNAGVEISSFYKLYNQASFETFTAGPVSIIFFLFAGFHGYGAIQALMDYYPYKLWAQYKMHRSDHLGYFDMLPVVLRNQFQLFCWMVIGFIWGGVFNIANEPPTIPWLLFGVMVAYLTYETVFHFTHWLLHLKPLYPYHKLHHITFGSVGISGMYQGHVDYLLTTVSSHVLSPLLFYSYIPISSFYFLAFVGGMNSIQSHGAYNFPLMPPPNEHSLHHLVYNVNFGTGIWDYIFNTGYNPEKIDLTTFKVQSDPKFEKTM